jgi:hypothetical protein
MALVKEIRARSSPVKPLTAGREQPTTEVWKQNARPGLGPRVAWYFGLTVMQIPSLGDLEPNNVLAVIASLNAAVLGGWLLVQIALET